MSDPQGSFDAARLDGVSDVLLLAAGTGELSSHIYDIIYVQWL